MIVRKDNLFPNGVLQFNSTASFKSFWEKVGTDPYYANKVTQNFKTFKNHLDDSNQNTNSLTASTTTNNTLSVDSVEFINDMKVFMLPEENLASVVNPEMQIIVSDTLYQFTRMGLFKVRLANVSDYIAFYDANKNNIFFDSNYVKVPNEVALGNGEFQTQTGVVRADSITNDMLSNRLIYADDGGGCTGAACGGGGGGTGGGGAPTDYYVNYTVGESFDKEIGIVFHDWAKRRLTFLTRKINWSLAGFGFHRVEIKAKIQREKKFLWITYWGPSYADEIIVGCDNMSLETDFIFPYLSQYTLIQRPTFEGFANFTIGNNILNTLNVRVNLTALNGSNNFPVLTNPQISDWINKSFNRLAGNTYNNVFKAIETNIINSIDPSYLSTYATYTKKINELNEANKLKWVIGKAERPEGYCHQNTWLFDYNLGGSYTQNGGVGGQQLQYHYNYTMKAGSFYGRARVGNVWHGIRLIKI
jgi:hypothetical protein